MAYCEETAIYWNVLTISEEDGRPVSLENNTVALFAEL